MDQIRKLPRRPRISSSSSRDLQAVVEETDSLQAGIEHLKATVWFTPKQTLDQREAAESARVSVAKVSMDRLADHEAKLLFLALTEEAAEKEQPVYSHVPKELSLCIRATEKRHEAEEVLAASTAQSYQDCRVHSKLSSRSDFVNQRLTCATNAALGAYRYESLQTALRNLKSDLEDQPTLYDRLQNKFFPSQAQRLEYRRPPRHATRNAAFLPLPINVYTVAPRPREPAPKTMRD